MINDHIKGLAVTSRHTFRHYKGPRMVPLACPKHFIRDGNSVVNTSTHVDARTETHLYYVLITVFRVQEPFLKPWLKSRETPP